MARDVEQMAEIAEEEPQAALSVYNTGLSQRWTFVQRIMYGISPLFQPIEDVIRQKLIPALCGRAVSDLERRACTALLSWWYWSQKPGYYC